MAILLADYDAEWPQRFEREARRIRAALGRRAARVDHIGSTAVPGLAGKPVIDIQVTVPAIVDASDYRDALEPLGYAYTDLPFPYFHKPAQWPHSHHLHLRELGTTGARRMIAFRDWLRTHPCSRRAYEALKRRLAAVADAGTMEGRFRYSEAKTGFIQDIELRHPAGDSDPSDPS